VRRLRDGDCGRRRAAVALDPKELVRRGYDAIADRYAAWKVEGNPAEALVRDLDSRLRDGSDVLELGCGNGRPGAAILAARHRYIGVDISDAQLDRARQLVPQGQFVRADYTQLELEPASLDAVAAILTLTHVPRREHAPLFARVAAWLRPGGLFLASLGVRDAPGAVEEDWLGAPMFFSHYDAETNRGLLGRAGFALERDEVVPMVEEGHGEARFLWVLARKGV
jgi:SAM-dependent methyltransferase